MEHELARYLDLVVQDFKDKECTDAEPLERRMCAIKKMGELDAPNATIQRLLGR
nr:MULTISPECIES: hypothetical protein [Comamonas]